MLKHSGWFISDDSIIDVSIDFQRWYTELVTNLELMQEVITARYGEEYFTNAKKRYGGMLDAIKQNKLGGCILYATAI